MANMMPFGREAYIRSSTQERDIKYFTEQQLEMLSAALWNIQTKGCVYGERKGPHCGPWLTRGRDFRMLCSIMLWSGARVGEALKLTPLDIDFDTGVVGLWTEKRKGDVRRYVPLHAELKSELLTFLVDRGLKRHSTEKLIRMKRGLTMKYCRLLQAHFKWPVRTHMFRHTFAIRAARAGVPVNVLQKWLGHSSIFNTSIYTDVGGLDTARWMQIVRAVDAGDPRSSF